MNQLISLEPPDGDFAAYIEAIVGPPPEDPETAAREISEQLAIRSKDNIEIMNAISPTHNQSGRDSADSSFVRRGPLSTGGAGVTMTTASGGANDLPDLASALQQAAQSSVSGIQRLFASVSRLMIYGGIAWLLASMTLPDRFPAIEPAIGIGLLFIGIVLNNMTAKTRKS